MANHPRQEGENVSSIEYPDLEIIVLAAGKGTRMRSALPKVLHPVLGKPMLEHVLHTAESLMPHGISIVVGHEAAQVRAHIGDPANIHWVEQPQRLGTGDAVACCRDVCDSCRDVLILCGDTPLLRGDTLMHLVNEHRQSDAVVSFLSARVENPYGYGRVQRSADGSVLRIVEHKDADAEVLRINEVSAGIFCVRQHALFSLLTRVNNDNSQGEYYLPDIVPLALADGMSVQAVVMDDPQEMLGINHRGQLAEAEAVLQRRIVRDWQMQGVTIEQPESVRIEASVRLGRDCLIQAGCQLLGATRIGDDCQIGPYAVIRDAELDDGCRVFAFSHIERADVGARAHIGPFARLRPEVRLDEQVRIGNFVEIKKSVIGRGSKINHLSYVGDTTMGSDCNIGAGTITCNYDGANKHQTRIGERVFVGSDTKLIAPVCVDDDATIGAGSIITRNVPAGGLTLSARPEQRHNSKWRRPRKN